MCSGTARNLLQCRFAQEAGYCCQTMSMILYEVTEQAHSIADSGPARGGRDLGLSINKALLPHSDPPFFKGTHSPKISPFANVVQTSRPKCMSIKHSKKSVFKCTLKANYGFRCEMMLMLLLSSDTETFSHNVSYCYTTIQFHV